MKLRDITNIKELSAQQTQILKGGARDTGRGGTTTAASFGAGPIRY